MADTTDKVYYPETIPDNSLPNQGSSDVPLTDSQASANQTYSPRTIQEQGFPEPRVAVELLSQALNTRSKKIIQEFDFAPSGAIKIGEFTPGVSGDIRISPNGIVARDLSGNTTFALDGETGDAVFMGTIQAGSVISNGAIEGSIIEGGSININDKFIVDAQGNISIKNTDPTTLFDARYDDLVIEMINLDLGLPGTGGGVLRCYTNGLLYAYINPDDGLVLLNDSPVTITGTGAPAAPSTHQASIYVDQSGGKNRLMVRFPTGASQQLAIEP